jgi:3'-phosphoadenosine 5'-phosphosulfate sulfotransferase (PAPS reductase)/FAD synthetase
MKVLIFYSGGKDSQAALIHSIKKYGLKNCEAVFCDTGHENPQTYQHIIDTTNQLGVKLVTLKSKKYDSLFDLAKKKGKFPKTMTRFCTEELKVKPAIDYVLSHDESLIIVEGIRKDESLSRSKMEAECMYFRYYFEPYGYDKKGKPKKHTYKGKDVREWCKKHDASKFRPIFTWTAEQTLDYIKANNQQPNPLYFQGFSRVGCFPCIMANKREVRLIINNHREQWQAIKDAEKEIGSAFFYAGYIPDRYQKSVDVNGNKFAFASDVEQYLTANDTQLDIFEKPIGCMSVYNLCE